MELRSKVWIARDGEMVICKGRAELLEAVDSSGSISAAARQLEMNYRHAWSMLNACERHAGYPLLRRSKGGVRGGGASLTDEARELVRKYRAIEKDITRYADEKKKEYNL